MDTQLADLIQMIQGCRDSIQDKLEEDRNNFTKLEQRIKKLELELLNKKGTIMHKDDD